MPTHIVHVALQTPSHSGVGDLLSYASERPLAPGTLVRVPLGAREVLGVVWSQAAEPSPERAAQVRPLAGVFDGLAPLAEQRDAELLRAHGAEASAPVRSVRSADVLA